MSPSYLPLISVLFSFLNMIGQIYTIVVVRECKFVRQTTETLLCLALVFDIAMGYGITISMTRELWLEDIFKRSAFFDEAFEIQLNVSTVIYLNMIFLIDITLLQSLSIFDSLSNPTYEKRIKCFRIFFLIAMNVLLTPYYLQPINAINAKHMFLHIYAMPLSAVGAASLVVADSTIHWYIFRRIEVLALTASYIYLKIYLAISVSCPWIALIVKIFITVHTKISVMDRMATEQFMCVVLSIHVSISIIVFVLLLEEGLPSFDGELELTRIITKVEKVKPKPIIVMQSLAL